MRLAAFILGLILAAAPASAADNDAFNKYVGDAYAAYRAASNYLRTGNPGLASLELSGALESWRAVTANFKDAPLPPYDEDKKFAGTLAEVEEMLAKGLAAAEEGDAAGGAKAVEPVRGALYEMRKRNGVRIYADCITELNRAMDVLFKHRRPEPDMQSDAVRAQITEESKAYAALLADCRSMAPADAEADPEFVRLFDGTKASVESMFPAIDSKSALAVINVLRELRSFDRIIYFRFGG